MKPDDKGVYSFSIPADYPKRKEVRYFFSAIDINGNKGRLGTEKEVFKIKSANKGIRPGPIP